MGPGRHGLQHAAEEPRIDHDAVSEAVRFDRGAVLEAAEVESEGEESELEFGMGEEELIEVLRQLCMSAVDLQDLSGGSKKNRRRC